MVASYTSSYQYEPQPHPTNDMNGISQHHHANGNDDHSDTRSGAGLLSYFRLGSANTTTEEKPYPPPPPQSLPSVYPSSAQYEQQLQQPLHSQGENHDYSAMTLLPTNFRPMTMQPSKCSKLKVRIYFDSTIFQAGGTIFGRMEVTATSSRSLKLGEIAVELAAYEGPGIPPSNAVYGSGDENGFFMARKGKTTFPFAFQLPLDCPSSLIFGATASLRYVVTGLVQIFYHGKEEMVAKSKEAFVVEAWDGYNAEHRMPVRATNSTKLFWGGAGSLELEAVLPETLHSAGGNLSVEIRVRNNTARKVQGIRLGVARQLVMVANKSKAEENPHLKIDTTCVSETMGTQEFKTSAYLFDPGEERIMTLNMAIPINARTIRGTALFEVTCSVVVSMLLGPFSGELSVELPVKICHPASLTPAPKPTFLLNQHNQEDDADLDVASESGRDALYAASRRVGSNSSLVRPISPQRGRGGGYDDSLGGRGSGGGDGEHQHYPQGDHEDDRQLSPANSITSIRSIISKSTRLSKLADKIGRSTSPSAVSHLGIENDPRKRSTQKSTPLGPAQPIAYVPAVERVRYTPFQAPPTAKAKEFLKAATEYQNQLGLSGLLDGYGDKEIDLADGAMATAIHDWLARKEAETAGAELQRGRSRLKKRGGITANRQLGQDDQSRQDDREGMRRVSPKPIPISTSPPPLSPSRQQPRSPSLGSPVDDSPRDGLWSGQASPTSNGSFAFPRTARRAPAAPQTEAFGSAPEDSIVTPPLFHRPLPCPLPSPPHQASPTKSGDKHGGSSTAAMSGTSYSSTSSAQPQPPREAFERVRRMSSPVRDSTLPSTPYDDQERLSARPSRLAGQPINGPGAGAVPEEDVPVPKPTAAPRGPAAIVPEGTMVASEENFMEPSAVVPEPLNLEHEAKIKVPVPTSTGTIQQSALSNLFRNATDDGNTSLPPPSSQASGPTSTSVAVSADREIESNIAAPIAPPERTCKTPELSHVPMHRPLPAPKAKPVPDSLRQPHEYESHRPAAAGIVTAAPLPQAQQTFQLASPAPVPAPHPPRPPQPQPSYPVPPQPAPRDGPPHSTGMGTIVNKHVTPPTPAPRSPAVPATDTVARPMPHQLRAISPSRTSVATGTLSQPQLPPRRASPPVTNAPASSAPKKPILPGKKPAMFPIPVARPGHTPVATVVAPKARVKNTAATSSSPLSSSSSSTSASSSSTPPSGGTGFVYPKAARKPVAAPKPPGMVAAAKPKAASSSSSSTTTIANAAPRAPAVSRSAGTTDTTLPPAAGGPARGPQVSAVENVAMRSRSPTREQPPQQQQQQHQPPQEHQRAQPVAAPAPTHVVAVRCPSLPMDDHPDNPPMPPPIPSHQDLQQQQYGTGADNGQHLDNPENANVAQDQYGFRAPPIAMANSIRVQGMMADPSSSLLGSATGSSPSSSSSGSQGQPRYAVNTTVLRQAIGAPPKQHKSSGHGDHQQQNNSSGHGSGGGVADLLQGAKNVASAAVAGLGWRYDLHHDTKAAEAAASALPISANDPSTLETNGGDKNLSRSSLGIEPLPRSSYADRTIQYDLTMKDIDFQTVKDHPFPLTTAPSSSSSKVPYPLPPPGPPPRVMETPPTGWHAPSPSSPAVVTPSSARASSPTRVSAHSSRADSLSADVNLDKTLPKIHENAASRLEVLQADLPKTPVSAPASSVQAPPFPSPPHTTVKPGAAAAPPASPNSAAARNGLRIGLTALHGHHPSPPMALPSGRSGGGGGGPKVINPRLQEYIQKYNLAASARS
ncbi:hypothetical protein BGW41_002484 [Actinomortierella wolfii]|nr:hypothetical protein BGW41_002484 [Actinomortierella wolfii]